MKKFRWGVFKIRFNRWFYENVRARINPRQRWLTSKIPNTFTDVDYLMEEILFACMVNFWENDSGEESIRFQFESIEAACYSKAADPANQEEYIKWRKVYRELVECYNWARTRELAWEEFKQSGYNATYHAREQALIDRDTFVMNEIVRLRKWMWT